jgi:hypothetical protein
MMQKKHPKIHLDDLAHERLPKNVNKAIGEVKIKITESSSEVSIKVNIRLPTRRLLAIVVSAIGAILTLANFYSEIVDFVTNFLVY